MSGNSEVFGNSEPLSVGAETLAPPEKALPDPRKVVYALRRSIGLGKPKFTQMFELRMVSMYDLSGLPFLGRCG